MKGMEHTLVIIVAAVVILITAVVIITIFIKGTEPIVPQTGLESMCINLYTLSCQTTGKEPPDWDTPKRIKTDGKVEYKSCREIVKIPLRCENFKVIS